MTADAFALRRAGASDFAALTEVERAADTVFELIGISPLPAPAPTEEYAAAAVVIVAGEPPIGFARVDVIDGVAHLEQLSVHPDAARRGVGSRLLEEVVSWAREHGCRRVTLATFRDVAWNAPFYARHGFVEIVADTPFLEHVLEHERQLGIGRFGTRVLMARDLAGARRARFRPSTSGSETIMRTPRRRASSRRWAAALLWAAALTGTWMLLVAQSTLVNWVAAVGGGVVAALGARLLAARGHHAYTFRAGWLRWLPALTWQIVADFGIITAALGRAIATGRRTAGGGFVAREFDAGGDTARGRSWRAFVTLAATWSPNSYVVDIDRTAGHRINHDLVPHRASERPA